MVPALGVVYAIFLFLSGRSGAPAPARGMLGSAAGQGPGLEPGLGVCAAGCGGRERSEERQGERQAGAAEPRAASAVSGGAREVEGCRGARWAGFARAGANRPARRQRAPSAGVSARFREANGGCRWPPASRSGLRAGRGRARGWFPPGLLPVARWRSGHRRSQQVLTDLPRKRHVPLFC